VAEEVGTRQEKGLVLSAIVLRTVKKRSTHFFKCDVFNEI
jgi:hypothetical protein